jgi:hypothetical protein
MRLVLTTMRLPWRRSGRSMDTRELELLDKRGDWPRRTFKNWMLLA